MLPVQRLRVYGRCGRHRRSRWVTLSEPTLGSGFSEARSSLSVKRLPTGVLDPTSSRNVACLSSALIESCGLYLLSWQIEQCIMSAGWH